MLFMVVLVLASFLKMAISVNPYDLQPQEKEYFLATLPYTKMLYFLATFHIFDKSLRHLHCLLRKLGLYRRKQKTPIKEIIEFIRTKISIFIFFWLQGNAKLTENGFVIDS